MGGYEVLGHSPACRQAGEHSWDTDGFGVSVARARGRWQGGSDRPASSPREEASTCCGAPARDSESNGPLDGGRKAHSRVTLSHVNEGRTRHVKAGPPLVSLRQIKKQKHKAEGI